MIPKTFMKTRFGQELWEEIYGEKNTPPPRKKNISTYIPIRTTIKKEIPFNSIPTSTSSIDNLITTQQEQTQEEPKTIVIPSEEKPTSISDLKIVELHDIVEYSKSKGIVGEEALVVTAYLALSHNIHLGVEGYSGSGKTFLTDNIIDLIPTEDIYRIELSSKQAIFHDEDRINKANTLYFPELQKALQDKTAPAVELIKNIAEGRDAKRLITSKQLGSSDEFIITKDKTIIYTLAKENSFKKDTELSRRIMQLITNSSPEHFEAIHTHKANARLQLKITGVDEDLSRRLSKHLQQLRHLSVQVIDPFAEYLQTFIPRTQKSVGYIDHYYNLVDACTRFHYQDREHFTVGGKDYLLAHVQDHHYVHSLYYNEFIKTLNSLAQQDEHQHVADQSFTPEIAWKECFLFGRSNLYASSTLEEIVKNKPSLLKNWEYRQVKQGQIHTKDYKIGKLSVLVDNIELDNYD